MGTGPGALGCGGFPHGRWLHLPPGLSPQLSKEEETFSFRAQQDFPVSNLQPATVSLYDYYETGELYRAVSPAGPCPLALLPPLQPQGLSGVWLSSQLMSFGSLREQLLPGPWSPPLPLQVTVWMWPTLHPPAQVGAEPARPGVTPTLVGTLVGTQPPWAVLSLRGRRAGSRDKGAHSRVLP